MSCLVDLDGFGERSAGRGDLALAAIVAGLDHSELVAPELGRRDFETSEQWAAGAEAVIASRVPDIRFLLDYLLTEAQQ